MCVRYLKYTGLGDVIFFFNKVKRRESLKLITHKLTEVTLKITYTKTQLKLS